MGARIAAAVLALQLLGGCSGGLRAPASVRRAPAEVARLTLLLIADGPFAAREKFAEDTAAKVGKTIGAELAAAFTTAGYRIVTSRVLPHDMVAVLQGECRPSMGDQCRATLILRIWRGRWEELDRVAVDFRYGPMGSTMEAVAPTLVNRVGERGALLGYARLATPRSSTTALAEPPRLVRPRPRTRPTHRSGLVAASPQPAAVALVIGIEKYRDLPSAPGARADATRYVELAKTTLGITPERLRVAYDDRATRSDLAKQLEWLKASARPGGRVYLFYSGHGAPDPTQGTAYLVPYDGDAAALEQTALRLSTVLETLNGSPAKDGLVVIDSCFSGSGGRSVLAPGVRPLVVMQPVAPAARVALFSASAPNEISGVDGTGTRGLFSATFVEGLGSGKADLDGDGQISLQELLDWVRPRVARAALGLGRAQNPSAVVGGSAAGLRDFIVAYGLGAP